MSTGLLNSLRRLGATALELVQVRVELLATEIEREKLRLINTLIWIGAAVVLAGTGLALLAMLVAVYFWDSYRLTALCVLTLVYLAGAVAAAVVARRRWQAPGGAFALTVEELRRDQQALAAATANLRAAAGDDAARPPQP